MELQLSVSQPSNKRQAVNFRCSFTMLMLGGCRFVKKSHTVIPKLGRAPLKSAGTPILEYVYLNKHLLNLGGYTFVFYSKVMASVKGTIPPLYLSFYYVNIYLAILMHILNWIWLCRVDTVCEWRAFRLRSLYSSTTFTLHII